MHEFEPLKTGLSECDNFFQRAKMLRPLNLQIVCPACPACPVAPEDGTGVGPEDRTGVKCGAYSSGVSVKQKISEPLRHLRLSGEQWMAKIIQSSRHADYLAIYHIYDKKYRKILIIGYILVFQAHAFSNSLRLTVSLRVW